VPSLRAIIKSSNVFSLAEIVSLFDLKDINKAPASFNEEKLLWLNQEYIKNATPEHLIEHLEWHLQHQKIDISNGADLALVVASLQQRSKTLVEMSEGLKMLFFFIKTGRGFVDIF
jgi:glutamyl-tRNA synthetase